MNNRVLTGEEAKRAILTGAQKLYDAVKSTYGPSSGNVGIVNDNGLYTVTHDGVSVARSVNLKSPESAGADIIRQTASNMDNDQGDGTTTVTILAYAILQASMDLIDLGVSPREIKQKLESDKSIVLNELEKLGVDKVDQDMIIQVATISSGDKYIGTLVGETTHSIGEHGAILIDDSPNQDTYITRSEGYTLNTGYASPYFAKGGAVLEEPQIIIVDNLKSKEDIIPILQQSKETPTLVIAKEIDLPGLQPAITAKINNIADIVVIKAPGFGDTQNATLEDIKSIKDSVLSISVSDAKTVITHKADTKDRVKELTAQLANTASSYEKNQIESRIASLKGIVATIHVGGVSEIEIEEKKFRVEDAIKASRAALSGIVPGGATTPLHLASKLEDGVLKEALKRPIEVLFSNSNISKDKIAECDYNKGFDVTNPTKPIDLIKAGIVEPKNTIKKAIDNAVSVAGTAMTMQALIVPEEKDES